MLDVYAQTFMMATRQRTCTRVTLPKTRWWQGKRTKCIDLARL